MIITVDDFLKDPEKIREAGLRSKYPEKNSGFIVRAEGKFFVKEISEKAIPLVKMLDKLDGHKQSPPYRPDAYFQYLVKSPKAGAIHRDIGSRWTGIVFLSKKPDSYPGTYFFRHKKTKTELLESEIPKSKYEIANRTYLDRAKPKLWELTTAVEVKFNRLLLFRSELFHTNGSSWGKNIKDARLTYNFFLVDSPKYTISNYKR